MDTDKGAEYQRHENSNHQEESISHGETLIMQCIICAVILVFVLIATMTNIGPAATIRGGLKQVLTGAETLGELTHEVRQLGTEWFGWELTDDTYIPDDLYIPAWEYPVFETEEPDDPVIYQDIYEHGLEYHEHPETDYNYHPTADYES